MLGRIGSTLADVTVGTVIVLVHVALADREKQRRALVVKRPQDRLRARDLDVY